MTEQHAQRLAVIGSGYVGTVVASCFARVGHDVIALETDPHKLTQLRAGRAPFFETGLDDLLAGAVRGGRLAFTDDPEAAMVASDVVFLCVGTPSGSDGRPDMSFVESAARAVAAASDGHHVLVTKSTVPIGSGTWLHNLVEDVGAGRMRVVSNPEFLREGSAIDDFLHPDRVVLGSDDPDALEIVARAYRPVLEQSFEGGAPVRPPLVRTGLATAETVKYAANAFLATKISFINEIANICELVGADVVEVATAVGLDARIGGRFLDAGIGWGGSCFGKDLAALASIAEDYGYRADLLDAVIAVNQRQRALVVEKLQRELKILRGRRIGLLGIAFKPGTDDTRDSPALDLARRLTRHGATVVGYDPLVDAAPCTPELAVLDDPVAVAERADAIVITTDWPEFLSLDLPDLGARMRGRLLLDTRNMFDEQTVEDAGLQYEAMGRHRPRVLTAAGA